MGQDSVIHFFTQLIIFYFKESICWIVSFQTHFSNHLCNWNTQKRAVNTNLQICDTHNFFLLLDTTSMPGYPVFLAQNPETSLTFMQRTEQFEDTTKCMKRGARKHLHQHCWSSKAETCSTVQNCKHLPL